MNNYPATYGISQRTLLMDAFTVVMDRTESRTNTVALADARDLIYPIQANETIAWRIELHFGGNSPGDAKLQMTTPAGIVSGGFIGYGVPAGGAAALFYAAFAVYNALFLIQENSLGANDEFVTIVNGHLVNGANGGYFRLQWAQNGLSLVPSNLLAGSRLDVWKFAP